MIQPAFDLSGAADALDNEDTEFTGVGSWIDPRQQSDTGTALDDSTAFDVLTYSPASAVYSTATGEEPDNEVTNVVVETSESVNEGLSDATEWLPSWAPWAAGGLALVVILAILRPYASLGAEVVG